jgi:glucose-6-phosphate dehydrogenase assembly protein OpcA
VPFASDACERLLGLADRLVVDGSSWSGDGLARLRGMVALLDRRDLQVSDFALLRQSRWREAIASSFDAPDVQPFLNSLRRISVTYSSGPAGSPGSANVIRPLYHVAWLASRLGMTVDQPLQAADAGSAQSEAAAADGAFDGVLRQGRRRVTVELRGEASTLVRGTTLRVEMEALRRGVELRVAVTAGRDTVMVDAWRNGQSFRHRPFMAPRRTEVDMLAEVIESVGQNRLASEALRTAVALVSERARPRYRDE